MVGYNKTVTRVKPCFQGLQHFARLAFVTIRFRLTVSTMLPLAVTRSKICRSCLTFLCFKYLQK